MNVDKLDKRIVELEQELNKLKELRQLEIQKNIPKSFSIVVSNYKDKNEKTIHFIGCNKGVRTMLPTLTYRGMGYNLSYEDNTILSPKYKDHRVLDEEQVKKVFNFIVDLVEKDS